MNKPYEETMTDAIKDIVVNVGFAAFVVVGAIVSPLVTLGIVCLLYAIKKMI